MSVETLGATAASDPERSSPVTLGKRPLIAAVFIAGFLGWLAYSYPPKTWYVPNSMSHIGPLSSASDQAILAANEKGNLWKNSLLKFTLAGLAIGFSGLILHGTQLSRRWVTVIVVLVCGVVSGALAGSLGLIVRQYLDREYPIPLIGQGSRALAADVIVFALTSTLLLGPIAVLLLLQNDKADRQKASAVPLAGILSGLIVPLVSALALSGYTNTSLFPPAGAGLQAIWFGTMTAVTLVVVVFVGGKARARPTDIQRPAAV